MAKLRIGRRLRLVILEIWRHCDVRQGLDALEITFSDSSLGLSLDPFLQHHMIYIGMCKMPQLLPRIDHNTLLEGQLK